MITLFAIKSFSGSPSDGSDNSNIKVFGGLNPNLLTFLTEATEDFAERGAIRIIHLRFRNPILHLFEKIILLRRMRPDFLIGTGIVKDLPFLLFKPRRTKYLIFWQTILLPRTDGTWRVRTPWWLRQLIFRRATFIIGVSAFSAETIRKHFPNLKVVGITPGVDLNLFNPSKRDESYLKNKFHIDFSKPVVAFVGSMQPRKRPDVFIEIARRFPRASFVMAGRKVPGYDYISGTGDIPNFQWIPGELMSWEEVGIFFAASRAMVFPSLREPGAAVILESMASGSVPILSQSGGNGEFFKDGESGFLIPQDEHECDGFIEKLNRLVSDEALFRKMSQAARKEAEKQSYGDTAKKYWEVIQSLSK